MGDLNSVSNPWSDRLSSKKTSIPELQLIKYLQSQQFKDIYRFFFPNSFNFTFQCSNIQSRIDQIWTNISITNIEYTDIIPNNQIESDHHIITLKLSIILNNPSLKNRKNENFFYGKIAQNKHLKTMQHKQLKTYNIYLPKLPQYLIKINLIYTGTKYIKL